MSQSLALRADVRATRRALRIMDVRTFVAKDASRTTRKGAVKDGLSVEEFAEVLKEEETDWGGVREIRMGGKRRERTQASRLLGPKILLASSSVNS
jgi:hypothetical protein